MRLFKEFLKNVWNAYKGLLSIIIGHLTILKHIFKRPVTLQYPEKKKEHNENFRGIHALVVDEDEKLLCTACGTCQRVCPSFGTIHIKKEKNDEGKFFPSEYSIDLNKCIFCGNCVEYCPFGAIKMTKDYELADENKEKMIFKKDDLICNYKKTAKKELKCKR